MDLKMNIKIDSNNLDEIIGKLKEANYLADELISKFTPKNIDGKELAEIIGKKLLSDLS